MRTRRTYKAQRMFHILLLMKVTKTKWKVTCIAAKNKLRIPNLRQIKLMLTINRMGIPKVIRKGSKYLPKDSRLKALISGLLTRSLWAQRLSTDFSQSTFTKILQTKSQLHKLHKLVSSSWSTEFYRAFRAKVLITVKSIRLSASWNPLSQVPFSYSL